MNFSVSLSQALSLKLFVCLAYFMNAILKYLLRELFEAHFINNQ